MHCEAVHVANPGMESHSLLPQSYREPGSAKSIPDYTGSYKPVLPNTNDRTFKPNELNQIINPCRTGGGWCYVASNENGGKSPLIFPLDFKPAPQGKRLG